MYRRYRERRRRRRDRSDDYNRLGRTLTSAFRRPATQVTLLAVVALIVYLLLQASNSGQPKEISVSEAFAKYQQGAFFIDVRTQEEWNEFHAPNTSLIPLEQLPSRLNELPRDREIVVVCRSGNRSQQGRDILLNAGFTQVSSMQGGLSEWRDSGYPIEP